MAPNEGVGIKEGDTRHIATKQVMNFSRIDIPHQFDATFNQLHKVVS